MTIMKSRKLNFISGLFSIGFIITILVYGAWEQTTRPEFCLVCHMMKPEYYSWQASSHEKVPCLYCHENLDTVNKLKTLYYTVTNTYPAPIKMIKPIPNRKCERCHNINKRNVTPSGDLIIPHATHKNKKIACAKCHRGVAHGHISERRVTYKSDYDKWDLILAKSLITDDQTRTQMDTCMRCHEVRKAPIDCKTCHHTSMLPENHKNNVFKYKNHGQLASQDLRSCDKCHSYMSPEKYEGFEEVPAFKEFLKSSDKLQKVSTSIKTNQANFIAAQVYAKTNTFCRDCHGKRPPSHGKIFTQGHDDYAKDDKDRCMTCHDNQKTDNPVVKVACSSCHPSIHAGHWQWKKSHPIELPPKPKVVELCYNCHVKRVCTSCHKA